MVKIVVAGGSGELAREVLDTLIAVGNHDVVIFSRQEATAIDEIPRVARRTVDYNDKVDLVKALQGVHTVLSFVNQVAPDHNGSSQKSLIDACIAAGVKRFAPSEYGCDNINNLPFWAGKLEIRDYLRHVNTNKMVLEYTLFFPGFFMNYLASPHKTANHVTPLNTFIDFQNRRAILVEGYEDAIMTYTTVQDIAGVVAGAIELEDGSWPEIGAFSGSRVTVSQILEVGAMLRGGPFAVEKVRLEDLKAGNINTSWTLEVRHPSFTSDQVEQLTAALKTVLIGTLLTCAEGGWDVGKEFNLLLPDYEFTGIEEFLTAVWKGRP